jgi:DNA-binding NtrC family response regulator
MLENRMAEDIGCPKRLSTCPTVLIIDDVPFVTAAMERNLRNDVIVLTANNGVDARRIIAERADIDALLLDVTMPDYDSVEMLKDLAKSGDFPPVILFSGYCQELMKIVSDFAENLGFAILNTLEKPASKDAILASLRLMK